MAISPINSGEGLSDLMLAALVGRMNQGGMLNAARWLGGYKAKGLAAQVWVNKVLGSDTLGQGAGSIIAPFKTIGVALSAMGDVKTKAGYEQPRSLNIIGGTHDVSALKLPMGKWIINLWQGAKLTGPLTFNMDEAKKFTSTDIPGVAINNMDDVPGGGSFDSVSFVQVGTVVTTAAYLFASRCTTDSVVDAPAATTVSVELFRCSVGELICTTCHLVAFFTNIAREVSVNRLAMVGGVLNFDVTTVSASNDLVGVQLLGSHTFTGPAASFVVDGRTNYWFITNGWALGAPATKVVADDLTP